MQPENEQFGVLGNIAAIIGDDDKAEVVLFLDRCTRTEGVEPKPQEVDVNSYAFD